jgi:antitoxin component YwqK of YwqJK toxin-antitoxin module
MRNDKKKGLWLHFCGNGQLSMKGTFKDGKFVYNPS